MKKISFFKTVFLTIALIASVNLLGQSTTKFNDGYLSVFKEYVPFEGTITDQTGTLTTGSATISAIPSTAALRVGMSITGTGIPANSAILTIVDANSITITANATADGTGVALTINGAFVSNRGANVAIEEYLPSAAAQTAPNFLKTIDAGANGLVVSGANTYAQMTRSENGRYLVIPGYAAAFSDPNSTFIANGTARLLNGTGVLGAGIVGTIYATANNLRGAASDDGTNFLFSGSSVGIRYSNNGTDVISVCTTNTSNRVVNIFNGQLFYSTGMGTGIMQVGAGKPMVEGLTGTATAGASAPFAFSVSPDGLTIYALRAANSVGRFTYSGTYDSSTFTYAGGTWTAATVGLALTGALGIAVDWTGYTFSATEANGAVIYACNPTTIVTANDNGATEMTPTTLRTVSGLNAFSGLSFSPIKQTVSLGANSPISGNLNLGATNAKLFQFKLTADEGNSTIKKLILSQNGTAVLGTDITNLRLIYDANANGIADASEITAALATGVVVGSNVTFSGISQAYINQGSNNNYIVIGDVSSTGTIGKTIIPSIVSNKTINSVNYTTNLVNAGGSFVSIGTTAPTGNTLYVGHPSALKNTSADFDIFVSNGKINLNAINGQIIEVYNSVGQRLTSIPAHDGLNTLQLSAKGVVLVKVGNKATKVVL